MKMKRILTLTALGFVMRAAVATATAPCLAPYTDREGSQLCAGCTGGPGGADVPPVAANRICGPCNVTEGIDNDVVSGHNSRTDNVDASRPQPSSICIPQAGTGTEGGWDDGTQDWLGCVTQKVGYHRIDNEGNQTAEDWVADSHQAKYYHCAAMFNYTLVNPGTKTANLFFGMKTYVLDSTDDILQFSPSTYGSMQWAIPADGLTYTVTMSSPVAIGPAAAGSGNIPVPVGDYVSACVWSQAYSNGPPGTPPVYIKGPEGHNMTCYPY